MHIVKAKVWLVAATMLLMVAGGLIMFAICHHFATEARGFHALGGELLVIPLPVMCWLVRDCIRDFNALRGRKRR